MYAEPEVVERVEEFGVCCCVGRATALQSSRSSTSLVHSGIRVGCYLVRSLDIADGARYDSELIKSRNFYNRYFFDLQGWGVVS